MKRKFMSKNVNIRDLLEKADKTLYKKRSNDPECPFFQFLPKEKNMSGTILEIHQSLSLESTLTGLRTFLETE